MSDKDMEYSPTYHVVMNHDGQYSIWPTNKPIPNGWSDCGKAGLKDECLTYIEAAWTDMRPMSLRRKMNDD